MKFRLFLSASALALVSWACSARVGDRLPDAGIGLQGILAQCFNGQLDFGELQDDCGGPCPGCGSTVGCETDAPCDAGVCDGVCPEPYGVCPGDYARCLQFQELTADQANRLVTFGADDRYTPKCVRIRLGQSVTFRGNFRTHALSPACGPSAAIPPVASGSAEANIAFDALGLYGYYCDQHGSGTGGGMAGAVQVVP